MMRGSAKGADIVARGWRFCSSLLASFGINGIVLSSMTVRRLIVVFTPAVRLEIEEQAIPAGGSTTLCPKRARNPGLKRGGPPCIRG